MNSRLTTEDGVELNAYTWKVAKGRPKLVVALLHGYGEHAGRYAGLAGALNERGIAVASADLRGHGRSYGTRGHVERFEEYHQDARAIMKSAEALAEGAPVVLLGHSMGGLIACDVVLAGHAKNVAALILSSPLLGLTIKVNPIKEAVGRAASRWMPTLALPSGLKGVDVCQDPEIQGLYDRDPLNNKNATARWFTEMTRAVERVHARAAEIALPLLLLYGAEDKVASAPATDEFAKKLRSRDATVERLAGHYHEIFNEKPEVRAAVFERVAKWLLARPEAKAA